MPTTLEEAEQLRTEFYERLKDAKVCPGCALAFASWFRKNTLHIEDVWRYDGFDQFIADFFHAENIWFQFDDATDLLGFSSALSEIAA